MSYARRSDTNQEPIVAILRQVGASVESLHRVGRGVPDLLIGFRGQNYLLEVKTEDGELNRDQQTWHQAWNGQAVTVRTADEALRAIGVR